jgi:SET domain-containing protein
MYPDGGGLVEVRQCPHGMGLFATRDITKGRVIREFEDVLLTPRPTSELRGRYALRIGENEFWGAFPKGSADYWSNFIDHSDDPNVLFIFDKGRKRAWLKAAKPIGRGSEIFLKYDSYFRSNPTF